MASPEQALATQLKNVEAKTGKTTAELFAMVAACGLAKVSEQRSWLMQKTGIGYGDANTIALLAKKAQQPPTAADADPLEAIYAGNKASLRGLHDAVMKKIAALGDFEIAPKKSYVSLRRRKQFAMVGPATAKAIEIGLNAKSLPRDPRLKVMPSGSMCQATTRIETAADLDARLIEWIQQAFDESA
jgi:predicted transport protein